MKRIKVTLNGFHGYETHDVLVDVEKNPDHTGDKEVDYYSGNRCPYVGTITKSAANKFGCNMSDCTCGESIDMVININETDLKFKTVEIRGNYPQNA